MDNDPNNKPKIEDSPEVKADTADTQDGALDSAINDIEHKESDILLEAETRGHETPPVAAKRSLKSRLVGGLRHIWSNKKLRYVILGAVVFGIAALLTIPTTRYGILNLAHVRVSANLVVRDDKTTLPLKNIEVSLAGKTEKTDRDGKVQFTGLKQGKTTLTIKKQGYSTKSQERTLGWGSNPLGDIAIQATGTRFSFKVVDWLSNQPISGAEASAGESTALSNDKGEIELVIEPTEATTLSVTVRADNFIEQQFTIQTATKEVKEVKLVLGVPHYFISKRSGTYDVYQVNIDGSGEKQLLAGTGRERDDMQMMVDQKSQFVALASTRENVRNKDGYLLTTLMLLDLKSVKEPLKIDSGEDLKILGWVDGKLVYLKTVAGTSGANPNRMKLVSYSPSDAKSKELVSGNYFSQAVVYSDFIYYALANYYNEVPEPYLFRMKPDATYKSALVKKTGGYYVERYAYDKLYISAYLPTNTPAELYEYTIGESAAVKVKEEPKAHANRLYTDSPDAQRAAWVDVRDGKGNLIIYNKAKKEDKVILVKSGLSNPVRWLSASTLVFRVVTQGESADYVINVDVEKPSPVKIGDVANVPVLYPGAAF